LPYFTTSDGVELYYTDQGEGQPIALSHGWPLCSDAWQVELKLFADAGYRAIHMIGAGTGDRPKPTRVMTWRPTLETSQN
jgi:non-heme chloroperoxidase